MENKTTITNIPQEREHWTNVTDCIILIEQGDNTILLKEKELKELEKIMGARFLGI